MALVYNRVAAAEQEWALASKHYDDVLKDFRPGREDDDARFRNARWRTEAAWRQLMEAKG